ncbi:hypothetical protein A2V82_12735 [candidate division KSB1 bacterium RBG_16_48_16]|nr:MAG: hypothetical protein A2V82_12735 [candidate division KSB1 bacterium RBG_16_48_16]
MEGFHYIDLFATKGTEYLLVIGFLLVLIIYWRFLNSPARATRAAAMKMPAGILAEWFDLAKNFYYHPGHTWALPEGDNLVKVGMDDFAAKLLGKADAFHLPAVGTHVEQGDAGWKIRFNSKEIELLSPVNGEVVAVNKNALDSPELAEQDPYNRGWLLKVKAPKMNSNLKNLLTGKLAVAWMENTVQTLRQRMAGDLGVIMQDGGLPISGFAKELAPEKWDEIAAEFFLTK